MIVGRQGRGPGEEVPRIRILILTATKKSLVRCDERGSVLIAAMQESRPAIADQSRHHDVRGHAMGEDVPSVANRSRLGMSPDHEPSCGCAAFDSSDPCSSASALASANVTPTVLK